MLHSLEQTKIVKKWYSLCPFRHTVSILASLLIGAFHLFRNNRTLMQNISSTFVRPWHRFSSRLCGYFSFSLAECLIALLVIFIIVYFFLAIVSLFKNKSRLSIIYRLLITFLSLFLVIYAGFCLFWGIYYYSSDFEEQSGIRSQLISTEQLTKVTHFFIDKINYYDQLIERDSSNCFSESIPAAFQNSSHLYDEIESRIPCLKGDHLSAKAIYFSHIMSYTNFTGFFFPFTGEANINVDCPSCLIPSTIAHEIAHQRGVAEEDEANFVAVLASLENGDPVFCYSSCLLAYIHLSNALYEADYSEWSKCYDSLSVGPKADLAQNNAYWKQFETAVSNISDSVYTDFLVSYGQTLGLKTYGKCVDLLVTYYYDDALEAYK